MYLSVMAGAEQLDVFLIEPGVLLDELLVLLPTTMYRSERFDEYPLVSSVVTVHQAAVFTAAL